MPLLLMRSSYIALHYFTLPYTSHSYIKTDEVILQSCDVRCRPSLAFPVVSTQSKASEGKSTQSNATQSKARQPNPVNSGLVASLQFTSTMYARVIGTLMVDKLKIKAKRSQLFFSKPIELESESGIFLFKMPKSYVQFPITTFT